MRGGAGFVLQQRVERIPCGLRAPTPPADKRLADTTSAPPRTCSPPGTTRPSRTPRRSADRGSADPIALRLVHGEQDLGGSSTRRRRGDFGCVPALRLRTRRPHSQPEGVVGSPADVDSRSPRLPSQPHLSQLMDQCLLPALPFRFLLPPLHFHFTLPSSNFITSHFSRQTSHFTCSSFPPSSVLPC
jgi:hypothetical protein